MQSSYEQIEAAPSVINLNYPACDELISYSLFLRIL